MPLTDNTYIASIMNRITQKDLDDFAQNATFYTYQKVSAKSAIYPGQGGFMGIVYTALKLNGEAGELAEHVGKALRDDGFGTYSLELNTEIDLTNERKSLIEKEIGDVLWYLSAICNELGLSMSSVAWTNLNKLKDRTERNMLQGSGDIR